ncbi:MAG: hypothetical protein ACI4XS_15010 [Bacillus sp. (in: firmicutes)]
MLLARKDILMVERKNLLARRKEISETLSRLERKIKYYDEQLAKHTSLFK